MNSQNLSENSNVTQTIRIVAWSLPILLSWLSDILSYELAGNVPILAAWAKAGIFLNKKPTTEALAVGARIGDEVDWRWYPQTTAPDM